VYQREILKNKTQTKIASHMRIAGIPWEAFQELSGKFSILLISRAYPMKDDSSWTYDLLVEPVGIDLLPQVRQFISDQSTSKK